VAEHAPPADGGLRHERPEDGSEWGLNFSTLDGWWAEAYDGTNGFAIGCGGEHSDPKRQDEVDVKAMYDTLENEILRCSTIAMSTVCRGVGWRDRKTPSGHWRSGSVQTG